MKAKKQFFSYTDGYYSTGNRMCNEMRNNCDVSSMVGHISKSEIDGDDTIPTPAKHPAILPARQFKRRGCNFIENKHTHIYHYPACSDVMGQRRMCVCLRYSLYTSSLSYFFVIERLRKSQEAGTSDAGQFDRGSTRLIALTFSFNITVFIATNVFNYFQIGVANDIIGWVGIVIMLYGIKLWV